MWGRKTLAFLVKFLSSTLHTCTANIRQSIVVRLTTAYFPKPSNYLLLQSVAAGGVQKKRRRPPSPCSSLCVLRYPRPDDLQSVSGALSWIFGRRMALKSSRRRSCLLPGFAEAWSLPAGRVPMPAGYLVCVILLSPGRVQTWVEMSFLLYMYTQLFPNNKFNHSQSHKSTLCSATSSTKSQSIKPLSVSSCLSYHPSV